MGTPGFGFEILSLLTNENPAGFTLLYLPVGLNFRKKYESVSFFSFRRGKINSKDAQARGNQMDFRKTSANIYSGEKLNDRYYSSYSTRMDSCSI